MKYFIVTFIVTTTISLSAHSEDGQFGLVEAPGATGSIFRFPNSMQNEDAGNGFAEVWMKQSAVLYKKDDTKLSVFGQVNAVRDTEPYPWNNNIKFTYGAALSTRIGDHLEVTLTGKQEFYRELGTDKEQDAVRFALDYYYYDEWPDENQPAADSFGFTKSTFKAYGTLALPASLEPDDKNFVISPGFEYAMNYQMPSTKFILAPFFDLHLDWDKDQNNYNNKIRPAVGAKLIYPIHWGELFVGVKYEGDYRPVNDTFDTGPQIYFGWYKGWNKEF